MRDIEELLPSERELDSLFYADEESVNDVYRAIHQLEGAKFVIKLIKNKYKKAVIKQFALEGKQSALRSSK